jgi:hypothetical protein
MDAGRGRRATDERERLLDACVAAERQRTAFLQRLPDPAKLTDEERAERRRLDALVSEARKAYEVSLATPSPPWNRPDRRKQTP